MRRRQGSSRVVVVGEEAEGTAEEGDEDEGVH